MNTAVWLENTIAGCLGAERANDAVGYLCWLDFAATRVNAHIDSIEGRQPAILAAYRALCANFAQFSKLAEVGSLENITTALKRCEGLL